MDDAEEASLELEAVKGLAPSTANVSMNQDGKKLQLDELCAAGRGDSARSSLLAVTVKENWECL